MPTPSAEPLSHTSHAMPAIRRPTSLFSVTCPPENVSQSEAVVIERADEPGNVEIATSSAAASPTQSPRTPDSPTPTATSEGVVELTTATVADRQNASKHAAVVVESIIATSPSPASSEESSDCDARMTHSSPGAVHELSAASSHSVLESPFPLQRSRFVPNSCSSLLQPGSKFTGEQKSENSRYGVQVEIQHVDMAESFLCGYLSIQGLTNAEQTLTTYFEGEIIGTKYTFQTKHPDWGSNEKVDMQHWARFPAWRPLSKQAKRPDFSYKNFAQRENIFMRWKEYFLVPDHTRKTINGASYEGFYYICFNQVSGTISGMYYHAKTAKYQRLELQHVPDHGCLGAMEFR